MTAIHTIRTGLVQVRPGQMESQGAGLARIAHMLFATTFGRGTLTVSRSMGQESVLSGRRLPRF